MTHIPRALVALLCMLLAGSLPAQVTTGTILGTVRDNTGALIIGATVTITDVGKGTSQRFETDDTGSYNAPFLVPGTYSVTVERTGFRKEIRSGIILQVDQKARIDFDLSVGAITESVDVSAAAPLIINSRAWGANRRIRVGQVGCGRIAQGHELLVCFGHTLSAHAGNGEQPAIRKIVYAQRDLRGLSDREGRRIGRGDRRNDDLATLAARKDGRADRRRGHDVLACMRGRRGRQRG